MIVYHYKDLFFYNHCTGFICHEPYTVYVLVSIILFILKMYRLKHQNKTNDKINQSILVFAVYSLQFSNAFCIVACQFQ